MSGGLDESDTLRNISPLDVMAMCQSLTQSAERANPQQGNRPNNDNVSPCMKPVEPRPSNDNVATVEPAGQPPEMAAMIIRCVGRAE